jgi:hypothetical protein
VREGREKKRGERFVGMQRRGQVHLYIWRRAGLADEVGSDTIVNTAGSETKSLNPIA